MTHTRANKGTCSKSTTVTLSPGGLIEDILVAGGCDGNLQGLCALLRGRPAAEAAGTLRGIRCEEGPTSCPAQIALCLEEALAALEQAG